jgi:hypothetical protein
MNPVFRPPSSDKIRSEILTERRVDPGTTSVNPPRVNPPSAGLSAIPKSPQKLGRQPIKR